MPKHTSSIVVVDDGEALAGCYATLLDAIRRNRAARLDAQRKAEPVGDTSRGPKRRRTRRKVLT